MRNLAFWFPIISKFTHSIDGFNTCSSGFLIMNRRKYTITSSCSAYIYSLFILFNILLSSQEPLAMLRKCDRFMPISYCIYGAFLKLVGGGLNSMFFDEKLVQYYGSICVWFSFLSFGNKFSYAEKKRFSDWI